MSDREKLKISTRVLFDEFVRQNIYCRIIDADASLLEYMDTNQQQHFIFSTTSDKSSAAGHVISKSKLRTEIVARELGIPMPVDRACDTLSDAIAFLANHPKIVVKPVSNSGGIGVMTNIDNEADLRIAYNFAHIPGNKVIAQTHIEGIDIRMLVVGGVFRSAIERRSATVTGDGISTINELILSENQAGERGEGYEKNICMINLNASKKYLQASIQTVPKRGEIVQVVGPSNISLGGTAYEATHLVTDTMIHDAEKITKKLGLGICGVDMMWDMTSNAHFLIEVNATPGIDMHNDPFWGTKSNAIQKYVEWLVQPNAQLANN